jgi:hypothetical protein
MYYVLLLERTSTRPLRTPLDVHIGMRYRPTQHMVKHQLTNTIYTQLMTVSLLTILALTTTIVLHCFYGLNPMLNTLLNSGLALLWSVAFSLLTWWSSSTLAHVCSVDNWDSDMGLHVCRLYKALFSFSLLGLIATLFALVLDVHVQRQASARGRFVQLGVLNGDGKNASIGNHTDVDNGHEGSEANLYMAAGTNKKQSRAADGYALPGEQYGDDTTYHGAAGQVGRRSMEERT